MLLHGLESCASYVSSWSFNWPFCPLSYIDPGAGTYLLQILIGCLLGGAFVLRNALFTIQRWTSKRSVTASIPLPHLPQSSGATSIGSGQKTPGQQ